MCERVDMIERPAETSTGSRGRWEDPLSEVQETNEFLFSVPATDGIKAQWVERCFCQDVFDN